MRWRLLSLMNTWWRNISHTHTVTQSPHTKHMLLYSPHTYTCFHTHTYICFYTHVLLQSPHTYAFTCAHTHTHTLSLDISRLKDAAFPHVYLRWVTDIIRQKPINEVLCLLVRFSVRVSRCWFTGFLFCVSVLLGFVTEIGTSFYYYKICRSNLHSTELHILTQTVKLHFYQSYRWISCITINKLNVLNEQ